MSGHLINWDDVEHWGGHIHVATSGNYGSDPGHDDDSNGEA